MNGQLRASFIHLFLLLFLVNRERRTYKRVENEFLSNGQISKCYKCALKHTGRVAGPCGVLTAPAHSGCYRTRTPTCYNFVQQKKTMKKTIIFLTSNLLLYN